jgi:hypothetical protein
MDVILLLSPLSRFFGVLIAELIGYDHMLADFFSKNIF